MKQFFATCPRGLEQVLAAELAALGAREVETVEGGASFRGDLTLCYAVNLESRIASRVLRRVSEARYRSEHDIFDAARALPWTQHFDVGRTIRVNVSAVKSPVRSLDFVTLRVKDARLVLTHRRQSDLPLTPVERDVFSAGQWYLQRLRFERDAAGAVSGMRASSGRTTRNITATYPAAHNEVPIAAATPSARATWSSATRR